jgi:hypothetical protein
METKAQDALAILKLYELRGEALMREARRWFFSSFFPASGKEVVALLLSSERESAYYEPFQAEVRVSLPTRLVIASMRVVGSTGLATCSWKPARRASVRSESPA